MGTFGAPMAPFVLAWGRNPRAGRFLAYRFPASHLLSHLSAMDRAC